MIFCHFVIVLLANKTTTILSLTISVSYVKIQIFEPPSSCPFVGQQNNIHLFQWIAYEIMSKKSTTETSNDKTVTDFSEASHPVFRQFCR